jgi:hypothetical protein
MRNRCLNVALVLISILSLAAMVCCRDQAGGVVQEVRLDALDGSRFYLGAHRGKTVVMVFWSVHCVPCHRQLVALSKHSIMTISP